MDDTADRLKRLEEEVEAIKERQIAEQEMRSLGHRMVWGADGRCNVPGVAPLSGDALAKQLERQRKYY